jgi:DhnA family fructose-bisphosphate aldolase class Ia
LARLLARQPAIILPLDDGLISGPLGCLADTSAFLEEGLLRHVDAILGFRGLLSAYERQLDEVPFVVNLSASTTLSSHTSKVPVTSVQAAVRLAADAVAFHLNVSDASEGHMLQALGRVVDEAERYGMPIMVIAYPRRATADGDDNYAELRAENPDAYTGLVKHVVRVAVEIGASVVKTVYTGTEASFAEVISAACGVPVLMAGGQPVDDDQAISNAIGAVRAGAVGVAFGRQVFMNHRPKDFLTRLRESLDRLEIASLSSR